MPRPAGFSHRDRWPVGLAVSKLPFERFVDLLKLRCLWTMARVKSKGSDMLRTEGRCALVTGITGQDGSYLCELLLEKGYTVHGIVRRLSGSGDARIDRLHELGRVRIHYGDLTDANCLDEIVRRAEPDEIYNLAAQSHVRVSFDNPVYTVDVDALGTARLLESAMKLNQQKPVRFYQASTSEMFGKVHEVPQRETTPFHPRSPYGCAKVFSHYLVQNYRESYGLFACSGILFNHESPRRGETFVTRKITRAVTRIREGLQNKLLLGNLDAQRDWGHARDYVEAMWLMLQQEEPRDYVIGTGETHSVREFLDVAFERVGLDADDFVELDPRFLRPSEVDLLLGDATKAREELGWEPRTTFRELVEEMVDSDWELAREERRAAGKSEVRRRAA